jgi:hypothetical protein
VRCERHGEFGHAYPCGLIAIIVELRDEYWVGFAGLGRDDGLDADGLFAEVEAYGALE